MLAFLVAVRDVLTALALAWVGYSLSPLTPAAQTPEPAAHAAPAPHATTACRGQPESCTTAGKPSFNALNCGDG